MIGAMVRGPGAFYASASSPIAQAALRLSPGRYRLIGPRAEETEIPEPKKKTTKKTTTRPAKKKPAPKSKTMTHDTFHARMMRTSRTYRSAYREALGAAARPVSPVAAAVSRGARAIDEGAGDTIGIFAHPTAAALAHCAPSERAAFVRERQRIERARAAQS